MPAPPEEYRALLEEERRRLQPEHLTATDLQRLASEWAPRVRPSGKDFEEEFSLALPTGETTGVSGPRWLFHLLGLPHRACDIGLSTPAGLVLLQRRSPEKQDNADLWDLSVTGHVSGGAGTNEGFLESAMREVAEELGLPGTALDPRPYLIDGKLTPVSAPRRDPPDPTERWWHCNIEVRQLFAGVLNGEGLASLALQRSEVVGVYLCSIEEAWRIWHQEVAYRERTGAPGGVMAPGGFSSLPHYLRWLKRIEE